MRHFNESVGFVRGGIGEGFRLANDIEKIQRNMPINVMGKS